MTNEFFWSQFIFHALVQSSQFWQVQFQHQSLFRVLLALGMVPNSSIELYMSQMAGKTRQPMLIAHFKMWDSLKVVQLHWKMQLPKLIYQVFHLTHSFLILAGGPKGFWLDTSKSTIQLLMTCISTDHSFIVSASDDSTVKIWDSRKLEEDISFRSRLPYHLEGSRALCAAMLWGSGQVIVGASDGLIHMFSIDHVSRGLGNVVEKYSGITNITKKDIKEGAILSLVNYPMNTYTIMYNTQNCGIHMWDTRSNSNVWTLKATPEEGYVSSLALGPCGNWFVSGSSRGVITLWDMRFLIPVNFWQYSLACPIEKMSLFLSPPNAPLSSTARPLVYVAAGCNEVSLWNAENGRCHQVLRVANYDSGAEMSDSPWALAKPLSKPSSKADLRRNVSLKYKVDELNKPLPRLQGIRSLLPLPGGDLLTGGTDLKIHRWDHCSPKRSYCICGPNLKGAGNDDFYETKSSFGVQVVQETKRRPLTTKLTPKAVLAAAAADPAGCHRDSILSLASVRLNQRLLLSSGRDGAIKVWK